MTASSPRIGVQVHVTREMIEAARDMGIENNNEVGMHDGMIAAIYRAMRALEPGTADPGVIREALPYEFRKAR